MARSVGLAALTTFAVACGGNNELPAKLDGAYEGTFEVQDVGLLPIVAEFDWRQKDELLFGQLVVTLPGEDPSVWAVRRWEGVDDVLYLDLTDTLDIQRGMDLDGGVEGKFTGEVTITFACPAGTCGYVGTFDLKKGGPGVTTTELPGG